MTDEQLKKLAFFGLITDALQFLDESRGQDPDDYHCCKGEFCGCGGMSNREFWQLLAGIEEET